MQEATNALLQMRFPQKLWYLLELNTSAILWGGTGRTILLNYRILQNYLQCEHSIFKTNNISSFIRQLNLYGFRKVTSHLQDPLCNSSNPYMHEFIHDNFQYGRPELLNKISRKALTLKKGEERRLKPRSLDTSGHFKHISPLQKARHALRVALKKAAQDLLILNSSNADCYSQSEDFPEDICEDDDNIVFDWCTTMRPEVPTGVEKSNADATFHQYGEMPQDLTNFPEARSSNNSFTSQFLSMPELTAESIEDNVEVLAEFNINQEIQGDNVRMTNSKESNSLNCVLPSVSEEIDDDVEKREEGNPYNGEWDQMFYDIMGSKSNSQEGVSNLRDLYSQISQTIDLLNS